MLDTYIKKQGVTQTMVHHNNNNHFNQIKWDADYDGNTANISVNSNIDGKRDRFHITLDNDDLADILNIPSVNMPIDKRLELDFQGPSYTSKPFLEFPTRFTESQLESRKPRTIKQIINRGISSPAQNEELIVPLTIDKKTMDNYVLTPNKRHRRRKSHITHKVYKKNKSSNKSSNKRTRSMRKSL